MKKLLAFLTCLLIMAGCGGSNAKYKVGVVQLLKHNALDKATEGFCDVLKEEFGNDVYIDIQYAAGESGNCATISNGFVSEGVDLILANATPALQAAAHATSSIPVLGTSVTEYGVALNLTDYNGVVGGNVSGTSDLAPLNDQAQMIIDLFPDAKTIGLLYCNAEANSKYQIDEVEKYLKDKGLTVNIYSFADTSQLSATVEAACSEIDVLYVPTDNTCADNGTIIANASSKANVPIITGETDTCIKCKGVATFSIDYYELGKTTGEMAIKILKGESDISNMPVEYYKNPVKQFNKELATRYNVDIPSDYEAIGE